jgi:hypothetical protein
VKVPVAEDMEPVAWADQSPFPAPTISGRKPVVGSCAGAVSQRTSCHSVFGYAALKQPVFGKGARDMETRQSSGLPGSAREGARSLETGTSCGPAVARLEKSPDSKLAATMIPRTLVKRPRPELEDFMGCPLVKDSSGTATLSTAVLGERPSAFSPDIRSLS